MIMLWIARVGILFEPEETTGSLDHPSGFRRGADRTGRRGFSVKALFWCATAIVLSLALGNLN